MPPSHTCPSLVTHSLHTHLHAATYPRCFPLRYGSTSCCFSPSLQVLILHQRTIASFVAVWSVVMLVFSTRGAYLIRWI